MTIWNPTISDGEGAIYQRIADRLEADVRSGLLLPGSRLPTHRELARMLGVTVVTATRAYAEAARRGLTDSAAGRGSFVRKPGRATGSPMPVDLATNVVHGSLQLAPAILRRLEAAANRGYETGCGSERHRTAAARWVRAARPDAESSRIVITSGAQHAILLALAATTRRGDRVLVEEVTYHGFKAAAAMLDLTLVPLPLDRQGVIPESLQALLRKRNAPSVIYLLPTLQNPTGSVMPERRRKSIANLLDHYGITLIEDDVYSFLAPGGPTAIGSALPDRSIFISGTGKALSPALRTGYLLAPAALLPRFQQLLSATTMFASPLGAEVSASLIEDGTADRMTLAKRESIALRRRLLERVLGSSSTASDPLSPHIWVPAESQEEVEQITQAARARNLLLQPAAVFATGTGAPAAFRLSIGAPASVAELETGLHIFASLQRSTPHQRQMVI